MENKKNVRKAIFWLIFVLAGVSIIVLNTNDNLYLDLLAGLMTAAVCFIMAWDKTNALQNPHVMKIIFLVAGFVLLLAVLVNFFIRLVG